MVDQWQSDTPSNNIDRYRGLFEDSPVSLWEEDFSEVKKHLDRLKQQGVVDFNQYLNDHPEEIAACVSLVRVIDVNLTTLETFHAASKAELLQGLDKIFAPQVFTIFKEELIAIAASKRVFESEGINSTLTGKSIHIHLRWAIAPGCEDTLSRVFVSILDITARKRSEELAGRQARYAQALIEISNAISGANLDAQVIHKIIVERTAHLVNCTCLLVLKSEDGTHEEVAAAHCPEPETLPALARLVSANAVPLGRGAVCDSLGNEEIVTFPALPKSDLKEIINPKYLEILDPGQAYNLMLFSLIAQSQMIGGLVVFRRDTGKPYAAEQQTFLKNLVNQAALALSNARLHDMMKSQAHTDPLTGSYNRRFFFDLADAEISRSARYGHPLSMIMLDLDHFKNINDMFGHIAGDHVLRSVAERCQNSLRGTDRMGRFGGDEFAVLLPDTDLDGAAIIAERLRRIIADTPISAEGSLISLTASIGVSARTDSVHDLKSLLRQTDEAMYQAKKAGRNRVMEKM